MFLRSVLLCGAVLCVSACATVTIQPESLTTSLVKEETPLTKAAKTFTEKTHYEGWVEKSSPLTFIQSKIFGQKADKSKFVTYADRLSSTTQNSAAYTEVLAHDIALAKSDLATLNTIAATEIGNNADFVRSDVIAFEDALIAAKKTRECFLEAREKMANASFAEREAADTAIASYAEELETTHDLIERLSSVWQQENIAVS